MNSKKLLFAVVFYSIFMFANNIFANNITVSNFSLTGRNAAEHSIMVKFDISWANSWRTSSSPYNWDAAWVFIKYRIGTGDWRHAWLSNTGHINPTGSTISTGLLRPDTTYNATTNPGLGVFIYRDADGTGTFTSTGVQLKWNYGANGVADNAIVDFRVFAVEHVYVPWGSFYLGSGSTGGSEYQEVAPFYKYPTVTNPYQVTSEDSISVGASTGKLYYANGGGNSGDRRGPIPPKFPKGYNAFYCMKYEVSQQEYTDFLNTINSAFAYTHYWRMSPGLNRFNITLTGVVYSTTTPNIACNFMSWNDLTSYLDWSGLRPMTELEFEKACRGTAVPVPFECAWGTPYAAGANAYVFGPLYTLINSGLTNENIGSNYNSTTYVSSAGAITSDSAVYVSAASATSLGLTITVTTTVGLTTGMPVKVTAGTGTFIAHTFVTEVTDGTHFRVSDYPSIVLSGATVSGYGPVTVNSTTGLMPGMSLGITSGTGILVPGSFVTKIVDGTHFTISDKPTIALSGGTTVITGYPNGNCSWFTTMSSQTGGAINGPLRVGIFAANTLNTGRLSSGASFYGIMELSGNLAERPVSVDSIGRRFTGLHGDGYLDTLAGGNNGCANVMFWPDANTAIGSGFRGGAWRYSNDIQVSDRIMAANYANNWGSDNGGRGVRTAP